MNYETFFGLNDKPFRQSPDTDYFFSSEVHKEVMHHLFYSIGSEDGFVEITGEPGIGKTITVRSLLKQIVGEKIKISLIVNSKIDPQDLLITVALDFGLDMDTINQHPGEQMLRYLHKHLITLDEQGIVPVVIIDEAQNLSTDTLEQLCLISDLETEKKKLVKIILVGQLDLTKKLNRPELRKIYHRITIRYQLKPLSKQDMMTYVNHRIRIAGGSGATSPFSEQILSLVYQYSHGVPRFVNTICERTLMVAFAENTRNITPLHVKKALHSFMDKQAVATRMLQNLPAKMAIGSLLLAALVFLIYWIMPSSHTPKIQQQPMPQVTEQPATTKVIEPPKPKEAPLPPPEPVKMPVEPEKIVQEMPPPKKPESQPPQDTTQQWAEIPASSPARSEKIDQEKLFTPNSYVIVFSPEINRVVIWQGKPNLSALTGSDIGLLNLKEGVYFMGKDQPISEIKTIHEASPATSTQQELDDIQSAEQFISREYPDRPDTSSEVPANQEQEMETEDLTIASPQIKSEPTPVPIQRQPAPQPDKTPSSDALQKNQQSIAIPESLQKKDESALQKKDTNASESKITPLPTCPIEILSTPAGSFVVVLSPDIEQMSIWEGTEIAPKQIKQEKCASSLREGVYILGKKRDKTCYLFHPHFSQSFSDRLAQELWGMIGDITQEHVIPVLVSSSNKTIAPLFVEKAASVKPLVNNWAEAWHLRDIQQYMSFYNKTSIKFYKPNKQPINLSWEILKTSQTKIFNKATQTAVQVGNPIYLLDPGKPDTCVAIFQQKISDESYAEQGIKVFYLGCVQNAKKTNK
ncbi:MAG: AAA family ATPase, partial [Candidatus Magnetomorum sp.]|nr:AAA family ATPase [Candidatus Magnetomorum sp.]